jgi:hypothetical protein
MKKRVRLLLATGAGVLGALTLGYWIYATIILRAITHTFEAFGLPVQSSQNLGFYLLPVAGGSLIIIAISLLIAPAVHRRFAK